ncbi:hypothetical protein PsorP6_010675 [Peronosclerospora sorghi]|uniref:Uncharacterized protein n=1 Tax=Peronosclerospora sorghi TaxID=230839 RepID=A0ACC0VX67_9STRA|nr:hypothetical protein PsorP6_010675 [Peronosclerospora sorghi]
MRWIESNMEMNMLQEEESKLEARQELRKLFIGESFVRYSLDDDDDDFEVPSVLQAAANCDDEEEEDEPQEAEKNKKLIEAGIILRPRRTGAVELKAT